MRMCHAFATKQLLFSIDKLINVNCHFHLFPDIPPCPAAQVVHSAGRRFIVSPVPEARLKEPSCPTSPPPAIAPPTETGQRRVCACIRVCMCEA